MDPEKTKQPHQQEYTRDQFTRDLKQLTDCRHYGQYVGETVRQNATNGAKEIQPHGDRWRSIVNDDCGGKIRKSSSVLPSKEDHDEVKNKGPHGKEKY